MFMETHLQVEDCPAAKGDSLVLEETILCP